MKKFFEALFHNNRTKNYWVGYYKTHRDMTIPTSFAIYCFEKYLYDFKGKTILELGCGNARDSIYFAKNGLRVLGLDLVNDQLKYLQKKYPEENLKFLCRDFSTYSAKGEFDIVYSRFTLHTITEEQETCTLKNAFKNLKSNGLLMIEVRSIKDEMFKKSKKISETEAYTDHYRRFAIYDKLLDKVKNFGFEIIESIEANNLAVYNDDNPYVIRIIAKKHA